MTALPSLATNETPSTFAVVLIATSRPFLVALEIFLLRRLSVAEGRACGVPLPVTWSVPDIVVG